MRALLFACSILAACANSPAPVVPQKEYASREEQQRETMTFVHLQSNDPSKPATSSKASRGPDGRQVCAEPFDQYIAPGQ